MVEKKDISTSIINIAGSTYARIPLAVVEMYNIKPCDTKLKILDAEGLTLQFSIP